MAPGVPSAGRLRELSVSHFGLMDEERLELGPGFHVLSGETGAGKSLVVDAMLTALGERAGPEFIRQGASRAWVEAIFEVERDGPVVAWLGEQGIEAPDGELILRRELLASGRSSARLNGCALTLQQVRELAALLVHIHGQHEHQSLLLPERQLVLLDRFAGPEAAELVAELQALHVRRREIDRALAALLGDERDRARREDLLQFQVDEIAAAAFQPGEPETLRQELRRLAAAEQLQAATARAVERLYRGAASPSAYDLIARGERELAEAARFDPAFEPFARGLAELGEQLAELIRELESLGSRLESSPERMTAVQARLDRWDELRRKYGDSVEEVLAFRREAVAQLVALRDSQARVEHLRAEDAQAAERQRALAERLRALRQRTASRLSRQIEVELRQVGLAQAAFEVRFEAAEIGPRGGDRVEFWLAPNPGEPARPLAKAASGGELSRVMLALEVVLAEADEVGVLIFDEVDAGIGGHTAQAVAERLHRLGRGRQVIAITHLPQIAARADIHVEVRKETDGARTTTRLRRLSGEERVAELVRMLGADPESAAARDHALEMLTARS